MQCSNCGQQIPFSGRVCPWCHAEKSGDQLEWILIWTFGLVGAGVGMALLWDFDSIGVAIGALVGGVSCGIVGLILAWKITQAAEDERRRTARSTQVRSRSPMTRTPGDVGQSTSVVQDPNACPSCGRYADLSPDRRRGKCSSCGKVFALPPKPNTPKHPPPPTDGAGVFEINGVDKATGMDTVWYVTAASEANARVKAELEGIIVTSVTASSKS